jgi:Cupredoxin-like domain
VVHVFLNLTNFNIIQGGVVLARFFLTYIAAGIFAIPGFAFAADPLPVLAIHGNQFEPKQLALPAGVKLKLVIRNLDGMPAEFESYDLSREVVVPGHGEVTIFVGPLEPGNYQFFNDFNHDMQGSIVVRPAVNKEN